MKILLVNDYGYPAGGTETKLRHFRAAMAARGHDIRLFTSTAGSTPETLFADDSCWGTTSAMRILSQTFNPLAAASLRRSLRAFRPDVVHLSMFLTQLSPLILWTLRSVPTVYTVTWYRCICPLGSKRLPDGNLCRVPQGRVCSQTGCISSLDQRVLALQQRMLTAWKDRAFDQVVAVSEAVKQRLLAEGWGEVRVLPNGVPVMPARPPLSHPPLAMFCGRLVPEKGADKLLSAFARLVEELPEARLEIVGDGPEAPALRSLIAQLGVGERVSMTGHLDVETLAQRASRAWVQVVPSQWEEPFGLVAAEAMMRGTAVVATRYAGLAEQVVDGRTGVLTPPGDEEALSGAMRSILGNRERAESMGKAGRERALAHYSMDTFVEAYEKVYGEVAGGPPSKKGIANPPQFAKEINHDKRTQTHPTLDTGH